ncbi:hypothetical protein PUV54_06140 [Hyphococcus flavus]|uniref:Uncharacterized protein n=1 Tax=Hyphococcus flavus TaxID=1866326 RepID=A0AAE9ZLD2_9PROT|nr:hypothetical protein [Hyphococcus flavus]WDI32775.1 hypothetical protein PUV54_06140 [Hyphococcus flavus]
MCVTPASEFFWIGLALFAAVGFVCFRVGHRFWRDASSASNAEQWAEVFNDHGPPMMNCSLWLLILILAGVSCGLL